MKRPILTLVLCCLSFAALAAETGAETGALVQPEWLIRNLGRKDLRILDLQSQRGYARAHIPGAVHTDYGQWRRHGNLPEVKHLEALVGALGIAPDTQVILVPFGQGASDLAQATRVYWTLKYLGHDRVAILDGGLVGYARSGRNRPFQQRAFQPPARSFEAHLRPRLRVTKAQMKRALEAKVPHVDARSVAEYLGIAAAGGKQRAGTIPGALSLPYDWLTENGSAWFRSPAAEAALFRYRRVPEKGEVVFFCQSGHRASLAWFVAHELLGNEAARLYDGSMAEWGTDPGLPVEQAVTLPR